MEGWEARGEGREEMGGEGREGDCQGLVHTPMSKVLKNTLIVKLIWLAGAATQTFAPGGNTLAPPLLGYERSCCFCTQDCSKKTVYFISYSMFLIITNYFCLISVTMLSSNALYIYKCMICCIYENAVFYSHVTNCLTVYHLRIVTSFWGTARVLDKKLCLLFQTPKCST